MWKEKGSQRGRKEDDDGDEKKESFCRGVIGDGGLQCDEETRNRRRGVMEGKEGGQ